jgi:ribosomal protein L25 (general stress protein Ctc)
MKNSILSILLGFILIVAPKGASASFINFTIEKKVFNELSTTQQQAISQKVQELNSFFEADVYPQIPETIKLKIKDLKVTINFSDKAGRDGLFIPGLEDHQHKIVVQLIQINTNGIKALLAHEFFHAVHFEINPNEATWVREGMAQLFEYITTDQLNGSNLRAAIENPLTPLIGKYDINNANAAQYGHNMLYFYYLFKHCGGDNFFWSLAEGKDDLKGAYLIDSILANANSSNIECRSFTSSAISFEVAKIQNQIQESIENKSKGRERYFLAPTNLSPKFPTATSAVELDAAIKAIPLYSSYRVKLQDFTALKGQCNNCDRFYAKRVFPYDVSVDLPNGNLKNYDIILVKSSSDSSAD